MSELKSQAQALTFLEILNQVKSNLLECWFCDKRRKLKFTGKTSWCRVGNQQMQLYLPVIESRKNLGLINGRHVLQPFYYYKCSSESISTVSSKYGEILTMRRTWFGMGTDKEV